MKIFLRVAALMAALALLALPQVAAAQGDAAKTAVDWSFVQVNLDKLDQLAAPVCTMAGAQNDIYKATHTKGIDPSVVFTQLDGRYRLGYTAQMDKFQQQLSAAHRKVGSLAKTPPDILKLVPKLRAPSLEQTVARLDKSGKYPKCSEGLAAPGW